MTKYCDTCGTANEDTGSFCVSCGTKLENNMANPVNPTSIGSGQPVHPPQGAYPPPQGATSPPQGGTPPPQGQYPPPYIQQTQGQYPAPQYTQGQYPAQAQFSAPSMGYNTGLEKSPGIAFILSLFLPGFGHIYAGKTGTGIVMFLATIFLAWTFIVPIVIWIAGMIDSVNKVNAYNNFIRRYGRPPQPYEY